MKVPNLERAIVRPEKITHYLLCETHPVGRHKAKFFMDFGFSAQSWQALEEALRRHARQHEVAHVAATPFGSSYSIDGPLETPDGGAPRVRTVWFVETGQLVPYFVTAHPLEKVK